MKIAAGVILFSLSLASASWAQNKMAIEQLAAYNKPDREKILYEGAKSEGKITWYTSLAGNSYKELAAAFESQISRRQSRILSRDARRDERADHGGIPGAALHRRYDRNHYSALEAVERQQHARAVLFSDAREISGQRQRKRSQRSRLLGHRPRIPHRSCLQ